MSRSIRFLKVCASGNLPTEFCKYGEKCFFLIEVGIWDSDPVLSLVWSFGNLWLRCIRWLSLRHSSAPPTSLLRRVVQDYKVAHLSYATNYRHWSGFHLLASLTWEANKLPSDRTQLSWQCNGAPGKPSMLLIGPKRTNQSLLKKVCAQREFCQTLERLTPTLCVHSILWVLYRFLLSSSAGDGTESHAKS